MAQDFEPCVKATVNVAEPPVCIDVVLAVNEVIVGGVNALKTVFKLNSEVSPGVPPAPFKLVAVALTHSPAETVPSGKVKLCITVWPET